MNNKLNLPVDILFFLKLFTVPIPWSSLPTLNKKKEKFTILKGTIKKIKNNVWIWVSDFGDVFYNIPENAMDLKGPNTCLHVATPLKGNAYSNWASVLCTGGIKFTTRHKDGMYNTTISCFVCHECKINLKTDLIEQ